MGGGSIFVCFVGNRYFLHTYFWEEVETSPAVFLPTKPGDFITNDFITNVLYTPISSRVDDLFQNLTIVCAEI